MFRYLKATMNNINQFHYLKAQNKVDFKINSNVRDFSQLDKYEKDMRYQNLRFYAMGLSRVIGRRIAFIYTPIALVGFNIFSWMIPYSYQKTDKLDAYHLESTVFSEDKLLHDGLDGKTYYSVCLDRNFVDENAENLMSSSSKVLVQLQDGQEMVIGKLDLSSDGKLSVSDVVDGIYVSSENNDIINPADYDVVTQEDIPKQYSDLINQAITLMENSSYISKSERETLDKIKTSDKKEVYCQIRQYISLGTQEVDIYKTHWWLRVLAATFIIAYGWGIWTWIANDYPFEVTPIKFDGEKFGYGSSDESETMNLLFDEVRYKEMFIEAEKARIANIALYCDTYLEEGAREKILSKYEKKNLLK